MLGRQPVAEQIHPAAHRLGRRELPEQFVGSERQALDLVVIDGIDERFPGREVAVERGNADAGLAGDGAHRRLGIGGREDAGGRGEKHVAVAGRVRASGTGTGIVQNGSRSTCASVASVNGT